MAACWTAGQKLRGANKNQKSGKVLDGKLETNLGLLVIGYLILLAAAFLVIVEDVFADVFPALVLGRDVVDAALTELVAAALLVPHSHRYQHG